jgi:hypothetical protein
MVKKLMIASLHLPQQTATSSEDAAKHVHDHSATTHTAPAKTGASWVFRIRSSAE